VNILRFVFKVENGDDAYRYLLASKMEVMNPITYVAAEKSDEQRACKKAFGYAVQFSSGSDLVEEFLAAGVWPLGHNTWKDFTCANVRLPLYGPEEGSLI
jgi:hypothetical protein